LKVYSLYVNNLSTSTQKIQEYLRNPLYLAFLLDNGLNTDNLESLLIKPVQRIPRYVLLLEDLLKNTWPSHRDYENIRSALEKIRITVCNVITISPINFHI
jgi:hypothetical protein